MSEDEEQVEIEEWMLIMVKALRQFYHACILVGFSVSQSMQLVLNYQTTFMKNTVEQANDQPPQP